MIHAVNGRGVTLRDALDAIFVCHVADAVGYVGGVLLQLDPDREAGELPLERGSGWGRGRDRGSGGAGKSTGTAAAGWSGSSDGRQGRRRGGPGHGHGTARGRDGERPLGGRRAAYRSAGGRDRCYLAAAICIGGGDGKGFVVMVLLLLLVVVIVAKALAVSMAATCRRAAGTRRNGRAGGHRRPTLGRRLGGGDGDGAGDRTRAATATAALVEEQQGGQVDHALGLVDARQGLVVVGSAMIGCWRIGRRRRRDIIIDGTTVSDRRRRCHAGGDGSLGRWGWSSHLGD